MYSTPNDKHKALGHYESSMKEMDEQRNHYWQDYDTERRSGDDKVTGVGVYNISAGDKLCDTDHLAGEKKHHIVTSTEGRFGGNKANSIGACNYSPAS